MDFDREIVPGMSTQTIILLAVLVFIAWMLTKRTESFMPGKGVITEDEYVADIREMSSYVGPYIGEIYLYLRGKYSDPIKPKGPMFAPGSVSDPTLADPLLPIARSQIKAWIDSAKMQMTKKYGQAMMARMQSNWDLSYTQTTDGVMQVVHNENGKSSTYLV